MDDPVDLLPDPLDDQDFEPPDQEDLIQAFMTGLFKESDADYRGLSQLLATLPDPTKADDESLSAAEVREQGLIPEASDETLRAFSYSEMKLYKHAMTYKWTVYELMATIKLIKSTDFKVEIGFKAYMASTSFQQSFTVTPRFYSGLI